MKAGAIGELNLVEAWWDRNSPVGAWQYTLPADASPATVDWDRFLGQAPKRPFEPIRLFRWRNYRDYGTGVAGDLFVHLFSGMHFIVGAMGPSRIMATGGLRYWNDGRDVPDVMLGLYDYPKTAAHPAFTLALRVNFADGAGESSGFRFVGPEGMLTIGDQGVTLTKQGNAEGAGVHHRHVSEGGAGSVPDGLRQALPGGRLRRAGRPGRNVLCRPAATATRWITSRTSSTPSARGPRWSRTARSAFGRRGRR